MQPQLPDTIGGPLYSNMFKICQLEFTAAYIVSTRGRVRLYAVRPHTPAAWRFLAELHMSSCKVHQGLTAVNPNKGICCTKLC